MELTDWRLESLNINYNNWGDKKGTYTGAVKFTNGQKLDLNFAIEQQKSLQYLSLIQQDIVKHAEKLSESLIKSMPVLLTNNEEHKQISEQ